MLKYKGKGFLTGVPARDLTEKEVIKFGKERLLKSGLYTEEIKESTYRKKSKRLESAVAEVEDIDNGTGY